MQLNRYRKWVTLLAHVASWIVLFLLPYLLRPSYNDNHPPPYLQNSRFESHFLINCITWIGLFYVNAYLLIPRFINRKQYRLYFISLLLVIVLLSVINWVSFMALLPGAAFQVRGFVFFYLFPCLFFLTTSTALRMFQDRALADRISAERQTESLKTELSFLRSQVSPHFMFNVLNNMVALARKKSDSLEPSLIKLSSLLRYMLYETDEEEVSLEKEVEYLQSYIDLQQQRFGKNVNVKACLTDIDQNYSIAPMLLIPFVENAFKHGTGLIESAFINIQLAAKNGLLTLKVENRYNPQAEEIKDKTSGIGLNNVTRRLELLYPARHDLKISTEQNQFIVALQLKLH